MKGYFLKDESEEDYMKQTYDNEFKRCYRSWSTRYKYPDYRWIWAAMRLTGKTMLDYGCGDGIFLKMAIDRGFTVTGYDISQEALDVAKSKLQNTAVLYNDSGFRDLKEDSVFDNVCCFEVMEHTDNPEEILIDLFEFCKDGGRVFITVPIGNSIPDIMHKVEFDWYKLFNLMCKYTYDFNIFTMNKQLDSGPLNVFGVIAIKHSDYIFDDTKTVEENVCDKPISDVFKVKVQK